MSRKRGTEKKTLVSDKKDDTNRSRLILWIRCGFFVLLGMVVYIPALTNGFIWDDDVMLTENALMKAPDGLHRIWFSTELSDYFPLTSTTFWIEWRIWGTNPVGYNVLNILLHALGGILIWRVLLRLKIPGAWLAGILFTVHPVCVASVDWIAERKNTLSMVFYALALLLYLRFDQEKRLRFYWLALGIFLLALLSKTSVVVLPMVLLLCVWWQYGKITSQDVRRSVPFFALALVMGLVTVWVQLHEVLLGEQKETDTLFSRVLDGSWAIWFYFGKVLWPAKLTMIYPDWDIDEQNWISYLPAILWVLALVTTWRFRRNWGRPYLFGLGYFTVALLPVLGFFDMNFLLFSPVADHLQYVALPGVIALAVGLAVTFWQKWKAAHSLKAPMLPYVVAAIPILSLSVLTWKQSSVYANEETLWRDVVKKNPDAWIGYHNLADRLAELHRFQEATDYYQQALKLKPHYAKSHNNFGNCLHLLGRFDEAMDEFLDAVQDKPELAEAHNNLGTAYYQKQDYTKALEAFKKAVDLKPDYAAAYFTAGNSALKLGDLDSALNYYFTAARYNPDFADVQYNIGIVLSVRGETNSAVRYLQHALRLNPAHDLAEKELKLLLADTDERQ
jgi:protein O-mannosyl-transferase